jgi:hypothetical protein
VERHFAVLSFSENLCQRKIKYMKLSRVDTERFMGTSQFPEDFWCEYGYFQNDHIKNSNLKREPNSPPGEKSEHYKATFSYHSL